MAVKIKGLSALTSKLKRLEKTISGDLQSMSQIGAKASMLIIDRTRKGRDSTGTKGRLFDKYTKAYLETRKKNGRRSRVDLIDKGNMLASMTHKASKRRAIIFFRKDEENLKAHGLQRKRPFFGLTRNENRKIMRMIRDRVNGVIK